MSSEMPLASRFRPEKLEDFIGQSHIIGPGKMLTRLIQTDSFGCLIFYGPPGTGKTSLANVIANMTNADFQSVNATTGSKAEMQKVVALAKENLEKHNRKTILFIDEIHRFNKAQQDYLLPFTEDGTVILIGATTENPYFEVNNALLSRSTVFELKPIDAPNMRLLVLNALYDKDRGLGNYNAAITGDALELLVDIADGDARRALSALELAVKTTPPDENGDIDINIEVIKESIQTRVIKYDRDGDNHYDTISAYIKAIRGSDPDAAVYYLARMLAGGEDVKYIARRLMIHASEDVGMADPMALCVATNAALAVERVGMPEAQIILAQATIHIAMAPKSNSAVDAINRANELVKQTGNLPLPPHLQDCHYKGAAKLGKGIGYKYPHDFKNHYVLQQYMPDAIAKANIYKPSEEGFEKSINERRNAIIKQAIDDDLPF